MRIRYRGPAKDLFVLPVIPDGVVDVIAQEALDALQELLAALDVDLRHPVLAGLQFLGGAKAGTSRAFS